MNATFPLLIQMVTLVQIGFATTLHDGITHTSDAWQAHWDIWYTKDVLPPSKPSPSIGQ